MVSIYIVSVGLTKDISFSCRLPMIQLLLLVEFLVTLSRYMQGAFYSQVGKHIFAYPVSLYYLMNSFFFPYLSLWWQSKVPFIWLFPN